VAIGAFLASPCCRSLHGPCLNERGRDSRGRRRPLGPGGTRRSTASSTPCGAGRPHTATNSRTITFTSTRAIRARGSTAPPSTASATPLGEGEFDVIAVYSPDRLARRYAYQILLLEELRKAACDVEFIERPISDDPHDQLLLQIQGAIAEYERAVLAERFRRG
jgi:hypothetical protein